MVMNRHSNVQVAADALQQFRLTIAASPFGAADRRKAVEAFITSVVIFQRYLLLCRTTKFTYRGGWRDVKL
jgi:hypothetical protein